MTSADLSTAITARIQRECGYTQPGVGQIVVELLEELDLVELEQCVG